MSSELNPVVVQYMIVHKLDHRSKKPLKPSTQLTPNSPDAVEFVSQHISTSREHHRARQARFLNADKNEFMQAADEILAQPTDADLFIQHSATIAHLLFNTMGKNRNISPGDLVVCLFADTVRAAEPQLAVLKLDPQSGFRGVTRTVGSDVQVLLENAGDVLPLTEIQKCAFILPPSLRSAANHDLIVLDQQTGRYSTSLQIASFFLNRFLHCQFDFNTADLTHRVVKETIKWANAQTEWDASQKRRLIERARQSIANASFLKYGRPRAAAGGGGVSEAVPRPRASRGG